MNNISDLLPWIAMVRIPFKKLAWALATAGLVSGCGPEIWKWQEEAKLGDGRSLMVKREVIFGGTRLPWEKNRQQSEYVLSFSSPDNAQTKYEYRSVGGLAPGAIAFVKGVPYVLGVTRRGDAITYYDCPSPPYIIHRHENGKWKRDELKSFPAMQKNMNIVVSLDNVMATAKSGGTVTPAQIAVWNKDVADNIRDPRWSDIVRPPGDKVIYDCKAIGERQFGEEYKSQFRQSMPKNTE